MNPNVHSVLRWTWLLVFATSCGPNPRVATPLAEEPEPTEIAVPHDDAHSFVRTGEGFVALVAAGEVRVEGARLVIAPYDAESTVRIETLSVGRRNAALPMAMSASSIDVDGAIVLERAKVRERHVAFDAHTAQQWTFDRAPEGTGPLVIQVDVQDAQYRSTTEEGLVLDVGGRTVLYSHGAFVGADGKRTPVHATWDGTKVELAVPPEVVASSAYPATLDPIIRVEAAIDAPVYGSDRAIQSHPAAASNGTASLVVWSDYRTGRSYDVFGVRVDANGNRLEAGSFPIVLTSGAQWRPSAASSSSGYFVVWEDHREGASAIYGTRVSAAGVVLDEGGVLLSDAASIGYAPHVASDGTDYLIVWERQDAGGIRGLRGTKVSSAGVPAASFVIANGTGAGIRNPVVEYGGGTHPHYVVAWEDMRARVAPQTTHVDVYAARVAPAGTLVDATPIALTSDADEQSQPALAIDGTLALVCYVHSFETVGEPDADVDCRTLALDDGALGPNVTTVYGEALYDTPSVVVNPAGGFGVVASESAENGANLVVGVLTATGEFAGGPYLLEAGDGTQNGPTAVELDGSTFVAFQDDRDGSTEVYGKLFDGTNRAAVRLSTAAVREDGVDVAWGGSGYFAVWHDARTAAGSILGARVMADGRVLDSAALALSESTGPALEPAVAGGEGVYLAVWREVGGIRARRISPNGTLLEGDPLTVRLAGSGLAHPDVAWNGTHFLVAWEEYVEGNYDIYARRYSPDGTSPDATPLRVSDSPDRSASPAITTDGSAYYVIWTEASNRRIDATLVTGGENAYVALPLTVAESDVGGELREPSAAFGQDHVLIVWEAREANGSPRILSRSVGVNVAHQSRGRCVSWKPTPCRSIGRALYLVARTFWSRGSARRGRRTSTSRCDVWT